MSRSSAPKSEAFPLELSARMAVRAFVHCIERCDDLGPFCVGFGRVDWVGVDGRLTGYFFSLLSSTCRSCEEEISSSRSPPRTTMRTCYKDECHQRSTHTQGKRRGGKLHLHDRDPLKGVTVEGWVVVRAMEREREVQSLRCTHVQQASFDIILHCFAIALSVSSFGCKL